MNLTTEKLWYKQFWPWFLILFPAAMIVICAGLFYVALKQPNSMVKKDYYQDGLAINKNFAEVKHAKDLGLRAHVTLLDKQIVHVELISQQISHFPETIELQFNHPLNDKKDIIISLHRQSGNIFSSEVISPEHWKLINNEKHWYLQLQSANEGVVDWILEGDISSTAVSDFSLDAGGG